MIRKARVHDVVEMKRIIYSYAREELMLARSLSELYENIRDFFVCEIGGQIVGCCALHVFWENTAEIRALAVKPEFARKGIGTKLVRACLKEAEILGMQEVFTLTYVPGFFQKLEFEHMDKNRLPRKVWAGCVNCPKFPDCDEIALIKELKT
ncbi:MAG: N-acetyltransferase [Methanosarcinaceae archaeon]|nr:N-acetyltransferase [Methanosarcinaceae archaeon]MDD4749665.1 N-acetyltransferase [Methanosarcinaceae archaeon]